MSRCRRPLVSLAILITITLLAGLAVPPAPSALAQEATPEASPLATPMAEAPAPCGPEAEPGDELPAGLVREARFASEISLPDNPEQVEAVATLVCLAPGTTIAYEIPGFPDPTEDIGQDFTAQLVVVEGTLQIKLVKRCAYDPTSGVCEVTNGMANYRTFDDYTAPVELTAGWTTIPVGAIVTLSDVTVSMRSTDTTARFLAAGITAEAGGGACTSSCYRHPP